MNELKIFESPTFGKIRTLGTVEEPLFCAADVCNALGYSNGRDAISRHVDEGDVVKCDTPTIIRVYMMGSFQPNPSQIFPRQYRGIISNNV